ncbi:hypothetical protein FRC17_006053 [Serendipita sp. 399]|nr:hypothetical protein FRC17_006053 [Serendipita sp. 399]
MQRASVRFLTYYFEQICRSFQYLLKQSTHLQLVVELAVQGLRLRTYASLSNDSGSAMDMLSAFRRSQKAWKRIEPFKTARIPMSQVAYETSNRVFAHGILDNAYQFRGIEFNNLEVNSTTDPTSIPVWKTIENTGIDIWDYSFHVVHDLVVIVEDPYVEIMQRESIRVFLLTMTGGHPHPDAAISCLSLPRPREGTHLEDGHGTLVIWNWRTGSKVYERERVGGYAFLSPDTLFLFVAIHKDRWTPIAGIELLRLGQPKAEIFLGIPFRGISFDVTVLSDRPTVDSSTIPANVPLSPFVIDETAERIIVVQFVGSFIFVSCRSLLRILQDESITPMSKRTSKLLYKRAFKWDQWGPENAFWLQKHGIGPGFTAVSGARFCSIVESPMQIFVTGNDLSVVLNGSKKHGFKSKRKHYDEELGSLAIDLVSESSHQLVGGGQKSILIMDFNPRPILRFSMKVEETEGSGKFENEEANWWKRFRKRIKAIKWNSSTSKTNSSQLSKLPFRAYQRPVEKMYTDLILTTDHIIGMVDDKTDYEVLQFYEE